MEKFGYHPLPTHVEPKETPQNNPDLAEKYPLILTSGARILYYTHSRFRNLEKLRKAYPEPLVEIHPKTAEKFGVKGGDMVVVETLRGSIRLKAKTTEDILPNIVEISHGWEEANVNLLTDDEEKDVISGYPVLKTSLCRIRKI